MEKRQLGWANNWYGSKKPEHAEANEIIKKFREQKHVVKDIDVGPPHRGLDHVVTCEICGYVYHYDSSD